MVIAVASISVLAVAILALSLLSRQEAPSLPGTKIIPNAQLSSNETTISPEQANAGDNNRTDLNNKNASFTVDESKYGQYNSEHVHGAFMIFVEGEQLDFSQDKYQLKSRFIHVENNDGTTIHRHATGVPFGDFLKSIGINIIERCLVLDNETKYCEHDNVKLRFFLNHNEVNSIMGYIIQNGDRLLITYGNKTDSEINAELADLQKVTIITVNG